MSTSSALPRCCFKLAFHGAGRTGWVVTRCADDEPVAAAEHAQGEVGVLTEGAREALVEAADLLERGAAVGDVGGDPLRLGQTRRCRAPSRWGAGRWAAGR